LSGGNRRAISGSCTTFRSVQRKERLENYRVDIPAYVIIHLVYSWVLLCKNRHLGTVVVLKSPCLGPQCIVARLLNATIVLERYTSI
jgi:hypothetical protein